MIKKVAIIIIIVINCLGFNKVYTQKPLFDSTDRNVFKITGISSTIAFSSAYLMDHSINKYFENNKTKELSSYTNIMNSLGDKWIILPLNLVSYGSGWAFKDKKLQETSLNAFKSTLASGILTEGIKQISGRARPHLDIGPNFYRPFPIFRENKSKFKSLPSGHVSLAFAFFTPFAEEYSRWLYLIPASVAFSRVYKNKHWTSDVILGGTIGFLTGYFFQEKNKKIQISFNKIVVNL
jgi:membrane-associated phospholipid phosphatase